VRHRLLAAVLLLVLCGGCEQGTVRVCTWNLTSLGAGWGSKDRDLDLMARVIDDSCDVAGVQEVYGKSAFTTLQGKLRGRDGSWDGTLTSRTYRSEYYGVLFRKGVAIQAEASWRCALSSSSKPQRVPCAVLMQAGADPFWLVNVHVLWGGSSKAEQERRQSDVAAIPAQLNKLLGKLSVQQRLVLGDFNVQPKDAPGHWGTLTKGPPNMRRLSDDQPTNISGSGGSAKYSSSYDHILFTEAQMDRWTREFARVDPTAFSPTLGEFKKKVSDHIPLSVTIFE